MKIASIIVPAVVALGVVAGGWFLAGRPLRPSPPVIAIVPETTAQLLWESAHTGAARAAEPLGWRIYWNGPAREDDFPRQIQIVDRALRGQVDGLVLAPDHSVALISAVRAATDRGIPTVIIGSPLGTAPGGRLSFILNDDVLGGQLAAERMAPRLANKPVVAVVGFNANIVGSITRANSFEAALSSRVPGVTFLERPSDSFGYSETELAAEDLLRQHPEIDAIFTLNINQSRSFYDAMRAAGRLNRILFVACDQDLDLLHHLRSGGIDALVASDALTMGRLAIETIRRQRLGEKTEPTVLVPPVLITPENIDREQTILDMGWRVRP